jgi:DNA topoisomerase-2
MAPKYQKLTQREHVLKRPGMYVGSCDVEKSDYWLYSADQGHMVKRNIDYIPALHKIVDEVVVNAIDHVIRQKELHAAYNATEPSCGAEPTPVKNIKISVDEATGIVEVYNDGNGIEVEKHQDHDMYIGEMIFGNLLTSTNYDDTVERVIGGVNGFGAKLTNIFSEWFEIDTVDSVRKLQYVQRWENNMTVINKPVIKKCVKKPYTIIRFKPDYSKFGMAKLSNDMFKVFEKRAYDACAVTDTTVNIFFNGVKLDFKSFEKYCDLFLGPKATHERVFEKINDRWDVVASYSDFDGFEQISFVNGINTLRGGKHVDYITNQIVKKLTELIVKKKKDTVVKPQSIKDNLIIFVKSTIVNPSFDSQSKETLTTGVVKFGSKAELSDKFIEKLFKTELTNKVMNMSDYHRMKEAKKTDGKKTSTISGIENLDDANWAGTAKSSQCTLILTEGLSAKTMAIAGLGVIGRDKYGVFPLKGKLLNVKDVVVKRITDNEEISNIKKIMGLESGKTYTSVGELRYGSVMLLVDSDDDGSHIKGLLMNMFHTLWPSLVISDGFITTMLTPVVRATKNDELKLFYCVAEFNRWRQQDPVGTSKHWTFKYLKGLGSSKDKDAKEYFRDMKKVTYTWSGEDSNQALDLAFNKKRADDRKRWLENYDKDDILDFSDKNVSYESFVHKELIHFSNYDIERSIPSMCDGFKISQRKVMYGCFKRNLTSEIKVAQLTGYIAEHSAYHHGDTSLSQTIVGMAQDYVGSNNINLLKPNGQFGTRIHGGKDASSARYICTQLSDISRFVFRKEDAPLLDYKDDDGFLIEPEFFVPIIPLVLINGALGIGTGFSTNVPSYNPLDIVRVLRAKLDNEEIGPADTIRPWYRGYTGEIFDDINGKFMSKGSIMVESPTTVRIVELPLGFWTEDFKVVLESFVDTHQDVKRYESHYKPRDVNFVIVFASAEAQQKYLVLAPNGYSVLMNELKLVGSRNMTTTNMYLFNDKLQITKYSSPMEIIDDFYKLRLTLYDTRRVRQSEMMQKDIDIMNSKLRFIKGIIDDTFVIYKKSKSEVEQILIDHEFPKIDDSFEYLLKLPIYSLTTEKVDSLNADIANTESKYNELVNTDAVTMWKKELVEFDDAYTAYMIDWENECNDDAPKEGTRKQIRKKK